MTGPLFDIVIPTYNAEDWIETCVASVLNQSAGHLIRSITVLDDASTDGTARKAQVALSQAERTRIVTNPVRVGALQNLVTYHKGRTSEITVRVDGDDYLEPEALAVVSEAYDKARTVATYGGAVVCPTGAPYPIIRHENVFPGRWIFSNMMTWRQDLWQRAIMRYPECFDAFPWKDAPGGNPASDPSLFLPMVKVAFDEGLAVRPTYGRLYVWRYHPLNEQVRRRPDQIHAEKMAFEAIERSDRIRADGLTA
jgi:glycosyltransferase involved in cell wall biosynthesis